MSNIFDRANGVDRSDLSYSSYALVRIRAASENSLALDSYLFVTARRARQSRGGKMS